MTRYRQYVRKDQRPGRRSAAWRITAQAYYCARCEAAPGERCVTLGGLLAQLPHAARTDLASADGWINPDGEDDDE